jgi:ABC-type transport system involved in multi-copper enzyme maturation permease subunit
MRSKSTLTVFSLVMAVVGREFAALVRGLAFWTAVILPLVYLVLLVVGSPTVSDPAAVAVFAAFNVVSLVLGHGYGEP